MAKVLIAALALMAGLQALPASARSASGSPGPAADLPAGFTDGVPVGGADGPEGTASMGSSTSSTRAATHRYFGRKPWEAIQASAAATTRSCTISDSGLTALTVSPVFKESSAATTAATAPAPMTLSRYDEWSGTLSDSTNQNANYGLYAFRDPNTSYKRAFWHPGIGIWQYDTAGVGAPFTAIERMDVRTVSADVAAGMAARYCNPSASLIGHAAPFTGQERRNAAWAPWGYPCTLCEQEFQSMTASGFSSITLVDGISVTGGASQHTCTLLGVDGTLPCWYVDPSVGVIEGATGWATVAPLDGGSPTVKPTPLAAPFYVLDRGATEERHWLRPDTGYGIDISGSRQIGKNDRPRSNQAGSGITWHSGSGLCDLTTGHGACVPQPPDAARGVQLTTTSVTGTFRPVALDAQGDGKGDILWYVPGATRDYLWTGQGSGAFTATPLNIGGTYDDVLPLDIDGDGDSDILWYNRSTGAAYIWTSNGDGTWAASKIARSKGLQPLVVDTDGDGRQEVFWYGRGSLPDSFTFWLGSLTATSSQSVSGSFYPFTGDFDGDGKTDIFWYAPGSAADHVWYGTGRGTHQDVGAKVNGLYKSLVGDFDGDGRDDVFWYGPGSAPDGIWYGRSSARAFSIATANVVSTYQPIVVDVEGDGRTDIVWYAPGPAADRWYRWTSSRTISAQIPILNGNHQAIVGAFSAGGTDGVFWYASGPTPDGVWWH